MPAGLQVERLVSDPAEITFEAGTSLPVTITALDAEGDPVDAELRIVGRGVSYADGTVRATEGGEGTLIASVVLPADAPMAWGPQPRKGYLFFSDFNSGLWSVRVQPPSRPIS